MDNFNYGNNLRMIRLSKGISQEAMAFHLNISQTSYSRIESHSETKDFRQVLEIAKILEVPICELMPDLKEFDLKGTQAVSGSQAGQKIKEALNTNVGKVILLAAAGYIVNAVYEMAKGFCMGLGTSETTMYVVGCLSVLVTIAIIWYSVRKFKRPAEQISSS